MSHNRMTGLSLKCKQFLLDTNRFKKSDRLFVECNFREYLTRGTIELKVRKLFPIYNSNDFYNSHVVIRRDEFDTWELMKDRKEKLNKLKSKINE